MRDVVIPTIRQLQYVDGDACRACIVELQDAERQFDPRLRSGESMATEYVRHMHARCRDFAGTILVAQHDDAIVGLVMLLSRVPFEALDEPPGYYALVAELVVRESFRGLGVGRALLQAAERLAHESGATELRIGVLSRNLPARQLYLGEGFTSYSEILTKPLEPSRHHDAAT